MTIPLAQSGSGAVTEPTAATRAELRAAAQRLGQRGGGVPAARLLAQLLDPDIALERIVDSIRGNPVLAARVLKVANSPYYRVAGQVGTIERAVQLLGLSAIRSIAAAGAVDALLPQHRGQGFDPQRFRRHGVAAACAGQLLSQAAGCGVDGEAFVAGLLHDIGLVLLIEAQPVRMASYVPPESGDPAVHDAAEVAHFGITHAACGALLVKAWGLPAWLGDAIERHHDMAALAVRTGPTTLPWLATLADHVARRAGHDLWGEPVPEPGPELLAALALDEDALNTVAEALPQMMARLLPE